MWTSGNLVFGDLVELVKKLAMGSSEVAIDADVSKPLCKATSDAIKNYKWSSFKDGTSFVKFPPYSLAF